MTAPEPENIDYINFLQNSQTYAQAQVHVRHLRDRMANELLKNDQNASNTNYNKSKANRFMIKREDSGTFGIKFTLDIFGKQLAPKISVGDVNLHPKLEEYADKINALKKLDAEDVPFDELKTAFANAPRAFNLETAAKKYESRAHEHDIGIQEIVEQRKPKISGKILLSKESISIPKIDILSTPAKEGEFTWGSVSEAPTAAPTFVIPQMPPAKQK